MNTLPRSSYSFRRQGSSGSRIWDYDVEIKPPAQPLEMFLRSNDKSDRSNNLGAYKHDTMMSTPMPPSKSKRKHHTCGFLSIFGRCVRSSTSQTPIVILDLYIYDIDAFFTFYFDLFWQFVVDMNIPLDIQFVDFDVRMEHCVHQCTM